MGHFVGGPRLLLLIRLTKFPYPFANREFYGNKII